jgi:hypothetical protein
MGRKTRRGIFILFGVLLMSIVAGMLLPSCEPNRWRITLDKLSRLRMAVWEYRERNGRDPSVEELLESFSHYTRNDGWGRKIIIVRGEQGAFVFVSKGKDGILGTRDDMFSMIEPSGIGTRENEAPDSGA